MVRESPRHTIQPTALVHEAYIRLVADEGSRFQNRARFFSAAAHRHIDRRRSPLYSQLRAVRTKLTHMGAKKMIDARAAFSALSTILIAVLPLLADGGANHQVQTND